MSILTGVENIPKKLEDRTIYVIAMANKSQSNLILFGVIKSRKLYKITISYYKNILYHLCLELYLGFYFLYMLKYNLILCLLAAILAKIAVFIHSCVMLDYFQVLYLFSFFVNYNIVANPSSTLSDIKNYQRK